MAEHVERILPVTLPVAEGWGGLAAGARARGRGRVLPHADGLIAATARVHDLTPWTRNTRDFADTGVRLHDPWQA